jgi:CheY-like chemotaxis protein
MAKSLNILILEDNPLDLGLIKRELKKLGRELQIRSTDNKSSYIDLLNEQVPDILLSDYSLPDINGREALEILKKISNVTPFILISGAVGEEKATEMILNGASNFILKDNLSRLIPAIEQEIKN